MVLDGWWQDGSHFEQLAADPREVHEHDARVDPGDTVEGVACEAAVPADLGDLVLWGHGCKLRAVEVLEEGPDVVHGPEEQHVSIHIEQRVHLLQNDLVVQWQVITGTVTIPLLLLA